MKVKIVTLIQILRLFIKFGLFDLLIPNPSVLYIGGILPDIFENLI